MLIKIVRTSIIPLHTACIFAYICICKHITIYIHVHIHVHMQIHVHIHIHIHVHMHDICIYIYIQRERESELETEREGERERQQMRTQKQCTGLLKTGLQLLRSCSLIQRRRSYNSTRGCSSKGARISYPQKSVGQGGAY